MGFCPFLSFKPKHSGTVYDDTGSAISPTSGFSIGAVFIPDVYPNNFITSTENSQFDENGFFNCPQNNTCQQWAGTDCGLKSPSGVPSGPSAATLLNEFLGKSDLDELDLTPLGVAGSIYGEDFMVDDEDIPVILKAANDHPNFNADSIVDTIESGRCDVDTIQSGNDSTSEWQFRVTITDSTNDLIASGIEDTTTGDGMYIVIGDQGAFQIDLVTGTNTLELYLGFSDDPPLLEGSYWFKIDPKRITWDQYLSLFET